MYLFLNLVVFTLLGLVPAVVLSLLAGTWELWNVWVTAGIFIAWLNFQTLVLSCKRPDLLKERLTPGPGGRVRWTTARAFLVLSLALWIIAGLDQRFHWSNIVPPPGEVAGIVLFALGWGLATWAGLVNPFFSPEVRLQADRGQRVIQTGPYAIVRHPGYATILFSMLAVGLALNSLLALIPALLYAAVTVHVTAIEDRMLQAELTGYTDYAARVHSRLVPGLW